MNTRRQEWNFSLLYESDTDPKIAKEITETKEAWKQFVSTWKGRTDYLSDIQVLSQALEEYNSIHEKHGVFSRAYQYFILKSELNKEDEEIKASLARIENEVLALTNEIQFFELSLSRVKDTELQKAIIQSPKLEKYKHFFEKLFREGKYVLSDAEEKIINLTARPAYSAWTEMVSKLVAKSEREIVIDGVKKTVPFGTLIASIVSPRAETREAAGTAIHSINKEYSDIATEELNAILEYKRNMDSVRGLERPDLDRHISDDIESEVIDALVHAVSSRNSISHSFYKKKAARLGVDRLKYYDRVAQIGEYSVTFPYEKAVTLAKTFFASLDPEIGEIVTSFFTQGRIDPFPKKGKDTGGFCLSVDKMVPPYILMNYTETVNDVTTLVHELGHGVHYTLSSQSAPGILYGPPTSLAEVASTFFEGLVFNSVEKFITSDEDRNVLRYETVDQDIQTIFRQVALYRFEQELHARAKKEGYLATETICQLFVAHMKEYMGDAVEFDAGSEYWWVYWSHIRNFFYVYSYASGVLISKALQNLVKKNNSNMSLVKEILKAGGSKSPRELFAKVGIDITGDEFWNLGLDEIEKSVRALG